MATQIRLTRKTQASKMTTLQQDDDLWAVAQELEAFLSDEDLPRLTADDIAEHLTMLHKEVSVIVEPGYYWYMWNGEEWVRVCTSPATVSVRDEPNEDPILVLVEDSAQYL